MVIMLKYVDKVYIKDYGDFFDIYVCFSWKKNVVVNC